MTPWEWSMAAVILGPILAVIAMWFLTREQAQATSAVLFLATGTTGVLACGYGITATEPFLLPTDLFFQMVATFDKFSAMFFFPFALIVAALGVRWYAQRNATPRAMLQVVGAALMMIGTTWALLSTNILGIIAALTAIACGEACLSFITVRLVVLRSIGVMGIAVGLFVLSSGALFNDFATLAYIAAELDPARVVGAYIALLLGVVVLSGGWPFSYIMTKHASTMVAGAERALMRSVYVIVPLYLFIRALLFILPPLTLWFAIPVSAIGVLTMLSATHVASKRRAWSDTTFVFGVGVTLFMLSSAMVFQALGMFEAMNVTLFATILHIIGIVLAGAVEEFAPNADGARERIAVNVSLLALPPSVLFVSVWMFVSSVVVQSSALPKPLAMWFTIGTVFFLGALVLRGYAAMADIRAVLAQTDRPTVLTRDVPFLVLVAVSTFGAFFIPFVLSAIGAGPLTIDAETWRGAVVAGDGILSLAILFIGMVGFSVCFWLLRDKTAPVLAYGIVLETPSSAEFTESRVTMLRREMYKTVVQYVTVPGMELIRKLQAWHETHASKPVSPALGLMLFTVILTLVIAL